MAASLGASNGQGSISRSSSKIKVAPRAWEEFNGTRLCDGRRQSSYAVVSPSLTGVNKLWEPVATSEWTGHPGSGILAQGWLCYVGTQAFELFNIQSRHGRRSAP